MIGGRDNGLMEIDMIRIASRRDALALLASAGLFAAALAPSMAVAAPVSFTVPLTGAQQSPPVTTSGSGAAEITYDPATRGGNDEMREVLLSTRDPLDACKELTDRANRAGGHDNITVIVVGYVCAVWLAPLVYGNPMASVQFVVAVLETSERLATGSSPFWNCA